MDDLNLPERQANALKLRSKGHQKNVCKWAKRFEAFRSDPANPEYTRTSPIGDEAAGDFITFLIQSGKYAPTSIQTYFSYIRNYFTIKYGVRDGKNVYTNSQHILNRASEGYNPTKAPSFESTGVRSLTEYWSRDHSSDNRVLLRKVVSLCGVFGAERGMELHLMTLGDVVVKEECVEITIHRVKGDKCNQTVLIPNLKDVNVVSIFRDYIDRTSTTRISEPSRFFRQLHFNGSFMNSNVGKNYMGQVARAIAEELKYPNSDQFSGHSFRCTAATVMFENGATKEQIKIAGNWRSDRVMEGYIRNTKRFKMQQAHYIAGDQSVTTVTDQSVTKVTNESVTQTSQTAVTESSRRTQRQMLTIFGQNCNLSNFRGTLNIHINSETAKVSAECGLDEDLTQSP